MPKETVKTHTPEYYHTDMSVRTFDYYDTKEMAIRTIKKLEHIGKRAYLVDANGTYIVAVYND
jgi:hypothetical protein